MNWTMLDDVQFRYESSTQDILVLYQNRLRLVEKRTDTYKKLHHILFEGEESAAFPDTFSRPGAPLNAQLQITKGCNFACTFCYANAVRGVHVDTLNLTQWNRIIDILHAAGVANIQYVGGEAFFRKDFRDMYKHASALGLSQSVITNGIIPGTQLDSYGQMLGGFSKIQVSMNGIGATYDSQVQTSIWKRFLVSLRNIASTNSNV